MWFLHNEYLLSRHTYERTNQILPSWGNANHSYNTSMYEIQIKTNSVESGRI